MLLILSESVVRDNIKENNNILEHLYSVQRLAQKANIPSNQVVRDLYDVRVSHFGLAQSCSP